MPTLHEPVMVPEVVELLAPSVERGAVPDAS